MDINVSTKGKYENLRQTFLLISSMFLLMLLLGWMLFGSSGIGMAVIAIVALIVINPYFSGSYIIKSLRASYLAPHHYPELHKILYSVVQHTGIENMPSLYRIPSKDMNAFVIGNEKKAAIFLTDKLIQSLNMREIAGIVGHEVAHIHNRDLWVMSVADAMSRMINTLAMLGQVFLIFALPAILFGEIEIAILPLFLLLFSPTICALLQLALARTREFEADRVGAMLVGEVDGLVSALAKMERHRRGLLRTIISMPWQLTSQPLFRTHPPTEDRISKLIAMKDPKEQLGSPLGLHSRRLPVLSTVPAVRCRLIRVPVCRSVIRIGEA